MLKWFCLIFCWVLPVVAADINVTATVDRNQMRPGDTFTYTVAVTSTGSVSFEEPRLPDLSGFEMISSWSSSEMRGTFVGGQIQSQRSQNFNYQMVATKEGSYTIGAAEVVVNGQAIRTNPITIQVSGDAPQGLAQRPGGQRPPPVAPGIPDPRVIDQMEEDLFSQLLRRRINPSRPSAIPTDTNELFFIHVDVDKRQVYQGEQVTASWYLVARAQIADIDTLKYPTLSGFWKEDIEVATRLNFQPEVINGIPYQKALLASYALFPIKSGKSKVDSYRAKCRVVGFGGFGQSIDQQLTKQSEEITIEVLPLPETGRPAQFSGGVGEFNVSASLDAQTVKANSPLTLKVRFEGRGNAKAIDMVKVEWPAGVNPYETKSDMKFYPNGRSFKQFETLFVPRAPGDYTIPPLKFAFFDPVKKIYYEQETAALTFKVEPGEGQQLIPSEQLNAPVAASTEKKLVLPGLLLTASESNQFSSAQLAGVWSLIYLFTFAGLGFYAYTQVGRREKKEDLRRLVQRRISVIENYVDKNDWRKAGIESFNLVSSVLGEVAGLGGAAFEFDKLVEKSPPSFKREVAPQLKVLLNKLEIVGFAPEEVVGIYKDKKELKKLINETEKWLSKAADYDFSNFDSRKS